ncbi:MAG TPA: transglycosylase SLT domain-containing protein [Pseudomonadales bacterium]|nr:transglycosylase SLT domain-containing protein [Pseudomonadales bacterium]
MTASPVRRPIASLARIARVLAVCSFSLLAACTGDLPQRADEDEPASHSRFQQPAAFNFGHSDGLMCPADWHRAPALQPDLWDRITKNYSFKPINNDRIVTERNWYASHQAYLNRMSGNASRYLYYVESELERRKLPSELALLPIVESAYNPFAYSNSQASGLWQFIPSTAKHLEMSMNWWYDGRRDIVASTDNALDYLVFLRDHYDGDWLKALAAYNAGWGTIDRAVAKNKAKGLATDYWSLDVPAETRAYVPKLLALAQLSKHPETYGVHWAYIPNLPYFAPVNIGEQLDVMLAADMAKINTDELYLLNPGINRGSTPPGANYPLLVPIDQANDLQERLAGFGSESRLQWAHAMTNPHFKEIEDKDLRKQQVLSGRNYLIQSGDTLAAVSRKTRVSVADIKRLNNMGDKDPLILGQRLALPPLPKPAAKPGVTNKPAVKTASGKKTVTVAARIDSITQKNSETRPDPKPASKIVAPKKSDNEKKNDKQKETAKHNNKSGQKAKNPEKCSSDKC